ncbi:MAG: ABC1 kinase family protein [Desulfobacterales bacterium]
MIFKTAANLSRLRTIVTVLFRYGFGDLVKYLDVPGKSVARKLTDIDPEIDTYQRIRLALEELGPTFIKFGQVLSLRSGELPKPLIEELTKLQDEVASVETGIIREVVEVELNRPIEEVFIAFEDVPLAAASLSQVHKAVSRTTLEPLVLKVQRPGIRDHIMADLDILGVIAAQLDQRIERLRVHDLPGLVTVVRGTLERELDFKREARNLVVAERHMRDLDGVVVPRVYEDLSTERLLVMEYIDGVRIRDLAPGGLEEAEEIARAGLKASVRQILENGFFHADPHPGNLLISKARRLCILDWGMVGRLTTQERQELIDLIAAIVSKDSEELTEAVLAIATGAEGREIDRRSLERDLMEVLDSHLTESVGSLRVGRIIMDITEMVNKYNLQIPSNHLIMVKSLTTAEGAARMIYPQLNVVQELEPEINRLARGRFSPGNLWRTLKILSFRLAVSPMQFPRRLSEIVNKMERGDFRLRFEHHNLGDLRLTLEKIFSRLTMGVIVAAVIIGSSLIMTTGLPPLFYGYPLLGLVGYSLSAIFGLWLIVEILRSH